MSKKLQFRTSKMFNGSLLKKLLKFEPDNRRICLYIIQKLLTWKMSLMCGQASGFPPGMSDGPYLAPSSPPETPDPTNRIPFFFRSRQRRVVSWNIRLKFSKWPFNKAEYVDILLCLLYLVVSRQRRVVSWSFLTDSDFDSNDLLSLQWIPFVTFFILVAVKLGTVGASIGITYSVISFGEFEQVLFPKPGPSTK